MADDRRADDGPVLAQDSGPSDPSPLSPSAPTNSSDGASRPSAPASSPASAAGIGRRLGRPSASNSASVSRPIRPVRHASNLSAASSLDANSPSLRPADSPAAEVPSIQSPTAAAMLSRQASIARRATVDRPRPVPIPTGRSPSVTRPAARHTRQSSSSAAGLAAPFAEPATNSDPAPGQRLSPTMRSRDLPPLGSALPPSLPPQRSMSIAVGHAQSSSNANANAAVSDSASSNAGSPNQPLVSGTSLPRFWGVPQSLTHSPSVSVGGPDGVDPDFFAAVSGLTPAAHGPTSMSDNVSPLVPSAMPSSVPAAPQSGAAAYHSALAGSSHMTHAPISAGSGSGSASGSWAGSHDEPTGSVLLSPAQGTGTPSMPSSAAPYPHHQGYFPHHSGSVQSPASPSLSFRHPHPQPHGYNPAHPVHSASHLGSTPSSSTGSPAHLGLGLSDQVMHLRPTPSPTLSRVTLPDTDRSPDRRYDHSEEPEIPTGSGEMRLQKVPAHVHRAGDLFNPSPLLPAARPSTMLSNTPGTQPSSSGLGTPVNEDGPRRRSRSRNRSRSSSSTYRQRHPPPTPRGSRNASPERGAASKENEMVLSLSSQSRRSSVTSPPLELPGPVLRPSGGGVTSPTMEISGSSKGTRHARAFSRTTQAHASGLSLSRESSVHTMPPPSVPVRDVKDVRDQGTIRASSQLRSRDSKGTTGPSTTGIEVSPAAPPEVGASSTSPEQTSTTEPILSTAKPSPVPHPPALAASAVAMTTTPSPPTTATTLALALGMTGTQSQFKPSSAKGSPRKTPAAVPIPRTSPTHSNASLRSAQSGSLSPIDTHLPPTAQMSSSQEPISPPMTRKASLTPLYISPLHRTLSPVRRREQSSALLPTPVNSPEASDDGEDQTTHIRSSSQSSATAPPQPSHSPLRSTTMAVSSSGLGLAQRGRDGSDGTPNSRGTSPTGTFKWLRRRQSNVALGPLFSLPVSPSQTRAPLASDRPARVKGQDKMDQSPLVPQPSLGPTSAEFSPSAVATPFQPATIRSPASALHPSSSSSSGSFRVPLPPPSSSRKADAPTGTSPTGPSPWIESSVHARELPSLDRQPSRQAESFAHVILRSRASKMRHWKSHPEPRRATSLSFASSDAQSKGLPRERQSLSHLRSSDSLRNVAATDTTSPNPASGTSTPTPLDNDIAWVDWMDEYERFKQSRLLVQQRKRASSGIEATDERSAEGRTRSSGQMVDSAVRRPSTTSVLKEVATPLKGRKDADGFLVPSLPSPDLQRRTASVPCALPPDPSFPPDLKPSSRPRTLRGQVEAWWSAVKSGFNGDRPMLPSSTGHESDALPSPAIGPVGSVPARLSSSSDRPPVGSSLVHKQSAQPVEGPSTGVSYYSVRGSPRPAPQAARLSRLSYSTDVAPSEIESDQDNRGSQHGSNRSKAGSIQLSTSARNSPISPHPATLLSDPFATPHRTASSRKLAASPASRPSPSETPGVPSASGVLTGSDSVRSARSPTASPVVRKLGFHPRASPNSGSNSGSPGSGGPVPHRVSSNPLADPNVSQAEDSEDFIITFMWQTIRSRLQASKRACDAGLRRVVAEVNEFVEGQLHPTLLESDDADEEEANEGTGSGMSSPTDDGQMNIPPDSAFFAPPGTEATYQAPHLLQSQESDQNQSDPDETAHVTEATQSQQVQESPIQAESRLPSLGAPPLLEPGHQSGQPDQPDQPTQSQPPPGRRPPPPNRSGTLVPSDQGPVSNLSSNTSSNSGTPGDLTPSRLQSRSGRRPRLPWARQHLPLSAGQSSSTSRSTSRSHSPARLASEAYGLSPHLSPARRVRSGEPQQTELPYVPVLQQLVVLAVEMIDTSLTVLTQRSGTCSEIISKLQALGQTWDTHPDWPGRRWYVDVLLHVASLSRVTEWWVAEKADWQGIEGLEEEDRDKEALPVRFFLRPRKDHSKTSLGGESSEGRSSAGLHGKKSQDLQRGMHHRGSGSSRGGENSPLVAPTEFTKRGSHRRTRGASKSMRVPSGEGRGSGTAKEPKEPKEPKAPPAANVLMELSLDGDEILYLNPSWSTIVGSDAAQFVQTSIARLLAEADVDVFRAATQELLIHPAHTIEIMFRLRLPRVAPVLDEEGNVLQEVALFQRMEGKGMLMHDRATGEKTHSMWVFKPTSPPEPEETLVMRPQAAGAPVDQHLMATLHMPPLMCRICERLVPAFFFEKHSEICNEIHCLDTEIGECNETLQELRRSTQSIITAIDNPSEGHEVPEYNGIRVNTPSLQPPSALEGLNRSLSLRQTQPALVRKSHARALDNALHALTAAAAISTPAVKDEQEDMPIEDQQLLSPTSEDNAFTIATWVQPQVDDAALDTLMADTEAAIRAKLNCVNRMINTIVYCETVRKEWEARADSLLESMTDTATNAGDDDGAPSSLPTATRSFSVVPSQQSRDSVSTFGRGSMGNMDDLLSRAGDLMLDDRADGQDGMDIVSPASAEPSEATHLDQEVPPMDEGMMSESVSNVAAIPIPASSHNNSPCPGSAGSGASHPAYLSPVHSAGPRGSFLIDQSPGPSDAYATSFSPQSLANDGHGWLAPRALSLSHSCFARASVVPGSLAGSIPMSPRLPSIAPASRPTSTNIKDFQLIKPISKGAFGAVYLVKKRTTGDYFAMKVLKKSDMIAKNQVPNVKAERQILMTQTQSPFVVKLFFTFNDTDNLYLVMEYLPGGDLASLVKTLGPLGIEWTTQYVAEIVNGIDSLHQRGIVHRDLKPDNVLIDMKGHLKLTDFGLSKIGLLGRQQDQRTAVVSAGIGLRQGSWPVSSTGGSVSSSPDPTHGSGFAQVAAQNSSQLRRASPGNDLRNGAESSDSAAAQSTETPVRRLESPQHPLRRLQVVGKDSDSTPHAAKHFVGTPDYLAPETLLGFGMDNMAVDWWALGVMLYEFLFGIPPFHACNVDGVFDNILSRRLEWMPEEEEDLGVTPVVKDLVEKLLNSDPQKRLGANGAAEVKAHPFFQFIDWANLTSDEGPFVPQVDNPESTDYFDLRGAKKTDFEIDNARDQFGKAIDDRNQRAGGVLESDSDLTADQFGSFRFKNLPVLKQANDEVIRKMRVDSQAALPNTPGSPISEQSNLPPSPTRAPVLNQAGPLHSPFVHPQNQTSPGSFAHRHRSMSSRAVGRLSLAGPASPAGSASSPGSNPSRSTAPTSPAVAAHTAHRRVDGHQLQPSALSATSGSPKATSFGLRRSAESPLLGPTSISNAAVPQHSAGLQSPVPLLTSHMRHLSIGSNASADRPALSPLHGPRRSNSDEVRIGNWDRSSGRHPSDGSVDLRFSSSQLGHPPAPPEDAMEEIRSEGEGSPTESHSSSEDESSSSGRSSPSTVRCLIGEDNPIAQSMLESILTKFGCECVCVQDGSSVITAGMSDMAFVMIFVDLTLPVVDGQDAARMIKSTRNINSDVPMVALANVEQAEPYFPEGIDRDAVLAGDVRVGVLELDNSVFNAIIIKPLETADVVELIRRFGILSTDHGDPSSSPDQTIQEHDRTFMSSDTGDMTTVAHSFGLSEDDQHEDALAQPGQVLRGSPTPGSDA